MNLFEAFRQLDALNEDTFSVSDDGIKKLSEFLILSAIGLKEMHFIISSYKNAPHIYCGEQINSF